MRALETSQFHVAEAAALLVRDPIALLYVATVLARRLDGANRATIELRHQVETDQLGSVLSQTLDNVEKVLQYSGGNLVYAGYPYDPYA